MTERFRARIDITPVVVVPLAIMPPQGCATTFMTADDFRRNRGPFLRWRVEAREAVQTIEVTHRAMAAILAELAETGWPEDPPRPPRARRWYEGMTDEEQAKESARLHAEWIASHTDEDGNFNL